MSSPLTARSKGGRNKQKKGISFTVMVAGVSGAGKTTFVNTLCGQRVIPPRDYSDPSQAHMEEPISLKPYTIELEEQGTRVALTIVDTPGFGDMIDNNVTFGTVSGYLDQQYDDILAEEHRIKRNPRFRDNRVHALIYFITPTGHGLRELDVEIMRKLSPKVNIIPVIGKADSMTPTELTDLKRLIMEDIEYFQIPIYNFPYDVEEDDDETIEENAALRSLLPFAIVGSEETVETKTGQVIRARLYPWGIVEVDNPRHCDFVALRTVLLQSHLNDLKEITHDFLYENYRTEKLSGHMENGESAVDGNGSMVDGLASPTVRLREEQLRREEEKLRDIELKVQREISEKRQELFAKEEALRNLEAKLSTSSSGQNLSTSGSAANGIASPSTPTSTTATAKT